MNLFEQASRQKFRFPTTKGPAAAEDLWDMPLTSRSGFDLDSVAKAVNTALKSVTEESFVETKSNPAKDELAAKLELVKHVIAVKQEENAQARAAADKARQRAKLMDVLAQKQDASLQNLSEEEILAKLEAL